MSCVRSSEGGFQVLYPFGICGPVHSELSMSNRIRLSKFRFTLLYTSSGQCTKAENNACQGISQKIPEGAEVKVRHMVCVVTVTNCLGSA